jgi:hypothetical protein
MTTEQELIVAALAGARGGGAVNVRLTCPLCPVRHGKPDRKQSLSVHTLTGAFKCFRCGVAGYLPGAGFVGADSSPVARPKMSLPEGFEFLSGYKLRGSFAAQEARDYLRNRGVCEDLWAAAKIGACLVGRYAGRVVVPIFDAQVESGIAGWVARSWMPAEKPYLYPSGMHALFYNGDVLQQETDEPAILVEGVFDALACWPNGVACLGKPSDRQFGALLAARRPLAVVLDGDAHEEGAALAMRLRFAGRRAGSVRLPPALDPDEVDGAWLHRQARECLTHDS